MASASTSSGPKADSLLTPRFDSAIDGAIQTFADSYEGDKDKFKTNLPRTIAWTKKRLHDHGIVSEAKFAPLAAEDWKQMELPQVLFPLVQRIVSDTISSSQSSMPSPKVERDLHRPPLTFGTARHTIKLVTNHFLLEFTATPENGTWLAWQVEFPIEEPASQPRSSRGGASWSRPRAPRGAGKAVRKEGVARFLEKADLRPEDWLFDGGHRLYTRQGIQLPRNFASKHDVPITTGRPPLVVALQPATDNEQGTTQQSIDLSSLTKQSLSKVTGSRAIAGAMEGAREALRLLQVAIRCHAIDEQGSIAKGRRIVCPQGGLVDGEETALRHGRQLWMGFLANLELIDDDRVLGGIRCSLSLNYSASVGLPQMPAIDLVAHIIAEDHGGDRHANFNWYKNRLERTWDKWPNELNSKMLQTLNSEAGLRKLKVMCDYFGYERRYAVVGVGTESANKQMFWYETETEKRNISVAEYFKIRWKKELCCPGLPCLELGKRGNFVPIELITVLGGEHNLMVGKLRPEYQGDVSRKTTVAPEQRRKAIEGIIAARQGSKELGPRKALLSKGVVLQQSMLKIQGHILPEPVLVCANAKRLTLNGYANNVQAVAPPNYRVPWGLWSFIDSKEQELDSFSEKFRTCAHDHKLDFDERRFVQWPRCTWEVMGRCSAQELKEALEKDLLNAHASFGEASESASALLLVLLPNGSWKDDIYKSLKMLTETSKTRFFSFATQCVIAPPPKNGSSSIQLAERKLNNLLVKIPGKLRLNQAASEAWDGELAGAQAAHNVQLQDPHWLLQPATVVFGADVTHNAAGVSVAGVVATRGSDFATYLHSLRAQSPFVLGADKKRVRKSEERILHLADMAFELLQAWREANGGELPNTVLYYRDGVSDGQFQPVLTMELNALAKAFRSCSEAYDPRLVIIVGQKRHQTRFFQEEQQSNTSSGYGSSASGGKSGKGKNKGDSGARNVPAGTVAGRGIAQPGHLNFFLVSAKGIKGTSIPCHYHVLHADERLKLSADDLEQVTYQLCHLYSRADKTVGYAAPAYYADHLCERGKLYLEAQFPDGLELASTQPSSEDSDEQRLREQVEERVSWFNAQASSTLRFQGRNFFC
eukprot:TRINITY_DN58008_c0_g1_i1.p1 TRINITY_DN58008_c0_g1~~TRINITY_DN58008_c0_g1_i1.p1  ORF type:complete len:1106 (-),score=191.65 TRINITY_DN58008_c0_g1_i1:417-3734(-)